MQNCPVTGGIKDQIAHSRDGDPFVFEGKRHWIARTVQAELESNPLSEEEVSELKVKLQAYSGDTEPLIRTNHSEGHANPRYDVVPS